ncbi:ABC transporter A family member 1 [Phytophthora fragariae]|uniref:ABC transporter A family member 1 n=1 Tax=Phytophthora fragariae TaxID=53985 RepID=A0A6A3TRE4_9STRA|nr:ABC transporter A family member 1 [Phytophthora fragariae]KAE8934847.1 ABC transporter A family member 1 [Phytophthora fragariae]KAE9089255.1 ABC transporter A family member 1 [Phytophthora fragariae]KAE9104112.1 ABC transporter A family member 1 [Phytophthora fragariae]KAE9141813.1 ABC transporter A family member 1 [Phytophthora fragariae]
MDQPLTVNAPASSPAKRSNLRFVPTLLRKNWLLKRKHPVALFFEVLTPVLFIVVMDLVRITSTDKTVPSGFSSGTKSYNLFNPDGWSLVGSSSTPMFATPETTLSGLMLHLAYMSFDYGRLMKTFTSENRTICERELALGGCVSLNTSSPYALPSECEGRVSPFKFAIAPDDDFTRNYFFETMKQWYPTIVINDSSNASQFVIPSFEDSTVFFDTEDALEKYVKGSDYAKTAAQPRIFGAIVFTTYPTDASAIGQPASIEYTLRLNSTYVGDSEDNRYIPRTVGSDGASAWNSFERKLETTEYQQYTTNGFMTLQTLVTRFVNCLPDWDASTKTTTGACQVNASTALSSDDLDLRLLETVINDPATKYADALFSQLFTESSPLSSDAADLQLDSTTREALLTPLRQAPQPYLGSLVTPFPINSFASSSFYDAVTNAFPIFFILTYLHPLSKILVGLMSERETRSRELMKILGVKESSIVISWYLTYIVILFVSCVLQALAAGAKLFPNTNVVLLFLFFFLFSMSVLGFAFMISSMFSKSRTGVYVGFITFFIMYGVTGAFNDSSSESSKNITCLLAPVGLVFGINSLASSETSHVGISFATASQRIDNFRFSTALWYFALDTILYTLLGLYFEKVIPKEYGTPEKWYFPLRPSYWRKSRKFVASAQMNENGSAVQVDMNRNIEPVSADLREQERSGEALSVLGLRKVFPVPGGEKEAVKGLHINMYSGQITCLLGHNGAGKTTLISMLTGVTPPTAGEATFHGLSFREDMDEIRESLGICFQHDVLYPELSVQDHLEFYARIKGYTGEALADEVTAKIGEVGLVDKRDTITSALSGGMKRKLSVAISLLGDSSLVFLDEPTSGMDPYSRRSTWEILMGNRQNRVMVLTTHFMDEADILGDRIAIMAEGELRCCGSALYLKNQFGVGYNLTIVKEENCNDANVIDFVSRYIPSSRVLSNVGTEIAFQLPLDSSSQFPEMFRKLDENLHKLQVLSYGISVTTMEEVFIKVAEASDEDQQHTLQNRVKQHAVSTQDSIPIVGDKPADGHYHGLDRTGSSLPLGRSRSVFLTQMGAMIQKRFRMAKRDKKLFVVGLLLPVAWLIFGLSILKGAGLTNNDPFMALKLNGLEDDAGSILLPSFCEQSSGSWCETALGSDYFSGASIVSLSQGDIGNPPYSSDSPTVFDVVYDNPFINATDATGYQLKLSEEIFGRAFTDRISDQFGGYLIHADVDNNVFGYNVLVNTTLTHGSVVFKELMDQSLYRLMVTQHDSSIRASDLSLTVNNHPLPLTAENTALFSAYISFTAVLFIVIAFAYYPASIVVMLVRERSPDHNSKHQQLVSGVGINSFWTANYIWDFAVFLIPGVIALALIQAYDLSALTGSSACATCGDSTFIAVIVLVLVFGLAICPHAYCWSYLFTDPASSQTYMILINFVLGLALMIVSFVMQIIDSTESADKALQFIWRLSPLFCLGRGLLNLTIIEITHTGGAEATNELSKDPFALENTGYEIIYLLVDAVLYYALAVGIDYAMTFPKIKSALSKDPDIPVAHRVIDEDVGAEVDRVLIGAADNDTIKLQNLRKVYRKGEKVAVQDLSFGLKQGECFGFLGINGAGKTTTMKMLTGDIVPTSGNATLSGYDILTQQVEVRRQIGYCPQFDALIDLLTVREHLELFAKIKGVSSTDLDFVVSEKMEQLNLTAFEDKLAGSLSGGNKRKLSVAITMIGSPKILFLDEPSTGMDPVSRRFMWDVISEISTYNKESTVVLTTHSMEECEALCTRVGIMVGGELKCLGSVQHLKNRFGDGLMFDAKLQAPSAEAVSELVLRHFDSIDSRIVENDLPDTCQLFGNAAWAQKIVNTHPTGHAIANLVKRDHYVSASSLAAWWITETQFENVWAFLQRSFGSVELLERQHDSCWFKILDQSDGDSQNPALRLANVFDVVESAKARLSIREYSVSQTTLEQIFNAFASQQDADEPVLTTPTNSPSNAGPGLVSRLLRRG